MHLDSEVAAEQAGLAIRPRLAKLIGREVAAWRKGRDVVVAWGNGVETAARDAAARPELSVAPIYRTSMLQAGKPPPHRLVVFWPARCWPLEKETFARSPAWSVMTEDPPAFWLGWNQPSKALDSIKWPGLERPVHRFLEQIPREQAPARLSRQTAQGGCPAPEGSPMAVRLFDVRCDWLRQYAPETTTFDPPANPDIAARLKQLSGYMTATSAAVLSCASSNF